MFPKTGLNGKENNIKNNSQLNNEKLNQNSTVDQTKSDNGLKFELNFEIKDQLIMILNEFTSLLYSEKNKEKIIEKSNNLLHNLIDLPLRIDHIEENEVNSTNNHLFKPTLVIDYEMKLQIIDLLLKIKNYSILFKENKDAKSDLINQNYNLVIKLMQSSFQILKVDDSINNDFWKKLPINNCTVLTDNQLIAKSEFNKEIDELKKEISILNDQLVAKSESNKEIDESESNKEIDELKKELSQLKETIYNPKELFKKRKDTITCFTELKYNQFHDDSEETTTLPFECLGLDWMVKMKLIRNYYFFELILIDKLDSKRKVEANCELILLDKKDPSNKNNKSLSFGLILTLGQTFKSYANCNKNDIINYFNDDNILDLKVNLTAELTCKEM